MHGRKKRRKTDRPTPPPTPSEPEFKGDADRENNTAAGADFRAECRAVRCADGVAGAYCLGRPVHITDARSNASAYRDVRAYPLGDLRADEGDDGRALLRADHGHLRSIVDADGYGRAELYAVGHKRADQVGAFAPRFIYPCKQEQSSLQIRLR